MSYSFNAILYKEGMFQPNYIADVFGNLRPKNLPDTQERFVQIPPKEDIGIVFYFRDNQKLRSENFLDSFTFLFHEDFLQKLNHAHYKDPKPYQFYGLSFTNQWAMRSAAYFDRNLIEMRFLQNNWVWRGKWKDFEETENLEKTIRLNANEYDETTFFELLEQEEAPFDGFLWVKNALSIKLQDIMDALHQIDQGGELKFCIRDGEMRKTVVFFAVWGVIASYHHISVFELSIYLSGDNT